MNSVEISASLLSLTFYNFQNYTRKSSEHSMNIFCYFFIIFQGKLQGPVLDSTVKQFFGLNLKIFAFSFQDFYITFYKTSSVYFSYRLQLIDYITNHYECSYYVANTCKPSNKPSFNIVIVETRLEEFYRERQLDFIKL